MARGSHLGVMLMRRPDEEFRLQLQICRNAVAAAGMSLNKLEGEQRVRRQRLFGVVDVQRDGGLVLSGMAGRRQGDGCVQFEGFPYSRAHLSVD